MNGILFSIKKDPLYFNVEERGRRNSYSLQIEILSESVYPLNPTSSASKYKSFVDFGMFIFNKQHISSSFFSVNLEEEKLNETEESSEVEMKF
jgi:hypothetical protein